MCFGKLARRVYYAHSLHLYGTEQEKRDILLLESLGFSVLNPNSPETQAKCLKEKESGGTGMYMFRKIVQSCDLVAFRAYPDGSIPAGVHKEITDYAEGLPVIELPNGLKRRGLSVEDTREWLHELGQR